MRLSKIALFFALLLVGGEVVGQDIHFSQFYNAPLMLNPALTGKIGGRFRVGINYRNQWHGQANGRTTYATPAISFDMPIRLGGDAVGVGGYIVNDMSSGGLRQHTQVMLSGAYHKGLGSDNNHSISIGLQLGFQQRRLDLENIKFASQVNSENILDPSISSGEAIDDNTSNVDGNIGVMWSSKIKKSYIYGGAALFNIIQPFNTFLTGGEDVTRRLSVTGGADIRLSSLVSLLPSVIYMSQANNSQVNLGLSAAFDLSTDIILFAGAYYRVSDAVIPYVGLEFKGARLGLSYDINASSLSDFELDGGRPGTIELSLYYVGKYIAVPDVDPSLYCPRF